MKMPSLSCCARIPPTWTGCSASIDRLLPGMERAEIIRASLAGRGAMIRTRDLAEAVAVSNRLAPEHLELSVSDPEALLPLVRHAGAIFMGPYTSEALGDYCAGPNHVLPTSRSARFSSPLGVYDFQKRSSLIMCSERGVQELGRVASILARGESLDGPRAQRRAAARPNRRDQQAARLSRPDWVRAPRPPPATRGSAGRAAPQCRRNRPGAAGRCGAWSACHPAPARHRCG